MKATALTRSFLVLLMAVFTITLATTPTSVTARPATSYAFTVNTTNDTHDSKPGDGVCADQNGQCSLRAAIEEADALPAGSSITITVPAGSYGLTLGTLRLTAQSTISITGAGSTSTIISGNQTFGIMRIVGKVSASLSQLTIEGGYSRYKGGGGGIYLYGGTLSVSNVTFSRNFALGKLSHLGGGGIYNIGGTLTVSNSTFSGNTAGGRGGGLYTWGTTTITSSTFSGNMTKYGGGGIYNRGMLTVSSSIIYNNYANGNFNTGGFGGGIYNEYGGIVTMSTSSVSGNSAKDYGGGIYNNNGGTLSLSSSTVWGNYAGSSGGGIANFGSTLTVSSSTFSGNTTNGNGGVIFDCCASSSTVSVSSSTLSGNSACSQCGGGAIYNNASTVSVSNSTLSGNSAYYGGSIDNRGSTRLTATIVANSPKGGNCYYPVSDGGYNLDSGTTCGFSNYALNNTDPMLVALQDNGGPTLTMALLQGSPAIDWVALSSCPSTDQRGYPSPDNQGESACDIGAYESAY